MIEVKNKEELQSIFDARVDGKFIIDFWAEYC